MKKCIKCISPPPPPPPPPLPLKVYIYPYFTDFTDAIN